jgi:hypothetical protein
MAGRNPQTQAKRAREFALRERRERKQVKKAEAAALKAAVKAGTIVLDEDGNPIEVELDENGNPIETGEPDETESDQQPAND